MYSNDLLVGKGRPEVGPSRPEAMYSNDLLVGKGRPEVGPSRPEAMQSNDLLVGKAGLICNRCTESVHQLRNRV